MTCQAISSPCGFPSFSMVEILTFMNQIEEAMHRIDTKKKELSRIMWQKAIV